MIVRDNELMSVSLATLNHGDVLHSLYRMFCTDYALAACNIAAKVQYNIMCHAQRQYRLYAMMGRDFTGSKAKSNVDGNCFVL